MLVANARFAGMSRVALEAAKEACGDLAGREATPGGSTACVDCAGTGSPEAVLTLARFGRWAEILHVDEPANWGDPRFAAYNEAAYFYSRALALYAQGTANPHQNNIHIIQLADKEAAKAVNASANDKTFQVIIPQELRAVRAWRVERDNATAVEALKTAVAANDALHYLEPPRWYYPPRQCLGAALLASRGVDSNATEALHVFKADLEMFPENGWSLHGVSLALMALNQSQLAEEYKVRASKAWEDADVALDTSCRQLLSPWDGHTSPSPSSQPSQMLPHKYTETETETETYRYTETSWSYHQSHLKASRHNLHQRQLVSSTNSSSTSPPVASSAASLIPPPPPSSPPTHDFYGLAVGIPTGLLSGACIPLGLSLWRLAHRRAYPGTLIWYKSGLWWLGTLFYMLIGPGSDLVATTCAGVSTTVMLRMSFLVWTPFIASLILGERFDWKTDGSSVAIVLVGLACFFPIAGNMYSDYDYEEITHLLRQSDGLFYLVLITCLGTFLFLWFLGSEKHNFDTASRRMSMKFIPISAGLLNGISLCFSQAYTTMLFKSHRVDRLESWLMFGVANGLMIIVNVANVKSLRHNSVLEHVPVFIETELITVWAGGGLVFRAFRNLEVVDYVLIPISMVCIGIGACLTTMKQKLPSQPPLPSRSRSTSGSERAPLLPDVISNVVRGGETELRDVAAPRAPLPQIFATPEHTTRQPAHVATSPPPYSSKQKSKHTLVMEGMDDLEDNNAGRPSHTERRRLSSHGSMDDT